MARLRARAGLGRRCGCHVCGARLRSICRHIPTPIQRLRSIVGNRRDRRAAGGGLMPYFEKTGRRCRWDNILPSLSVLALSIIHVRPALNLFPEQENRIHHLYILSLQKLCRTCRSIAECSARRRSARSTDESSILSRSNKLIVCGRSDHKERSRHHTNDISMTELETLRA